MDFKFRFMEQIVGAFLVLTLIILLGAVILIGRGKAWFKEKVNYYVILDQGYNLDKGSAVKMLNNQIGKVVDVEPDEFGLNLTAYVEPGADFYDIRNVMVVKREMNQPNLSDMVDDEEEEL